MQGWLLAKEFRQPLEARMAKKCFSCRASRGVSLAHTLTLAQGNWLQTFGFQKCKRLQLDCFKPLSLYRFVQVARKRNKTNTIVIGDFLNLVYLFIMYSLWSITFPIRVTSALCLCVSLGLPGDFFCDCHISPSYGPLTPTKVKFSDAFQFLESKPSSR